MLAAFKAWGKYLNPHVADNARCDGMDFDLDSDRTRFQLEVINKARRHVLSKVLLQTSS
jgi:hypothetical protein